MQILNFKFKTSENLYIFKNVFLFEKIFRQLCLLKLTEEWILNWNQGVFIQDLLNQLSRIFIPIYIFYLKDWKTLNFFEENVHDVSPGLNSTEAYPEQSISPCTPLLIVRCARELSKSVTPIGVLQASGLGFGK